VTVDYCALEIVILACLLTSVVQKTGALAAVVQKGDAMLLLPITLLSPYRVGSKFCNSRHYKSLTP